MGDLMASGSDPGSTYTVTGIVPGVYREDRSVTTPGLGTQMYRVYGALFTPDVGWALQTGASAAYATVQNPDGTIHYFTQSDPSGWPTSAWQGSGNNAVYNAVDYGLTPGTDADQTTNTMALQSAVSAAFGAGGGTVVIPSGTYQINDTVVIDYTSVPGNDHGVIITGTSGDAELVQNNTSANTFSFSGLSSGRGVRIRDLRITYVTGGTAPIPLPIAVLAVGCQNLVCERVYFNNCPTALSIQNGSGPGGNSPQCGLIDCSIFYNSYPGATMVYINGPESFIDKCVIFQQSMALGGPAGCTGITVQQGSADYFITNSHIEHFQVGILVEEEGANLTHLFISNVVCESWTTALKIIPTSNAGQINQVLCSDCVFARTTDSDDIASVGVFIDTDGGPNTNVTDIYLNNCLVYRWNGPGVQINAGQNVVITGGRYGSNATSLPLSGGIAITGTAASVTITGADCTPQVQPSSGEELEVQPYALSITGAVAGLYVRGCNFTQYGSSGPVYSSASGAVVEITDCAGYNDLGTVLQYTGLPPASIRNTSWTYFGPIAFYVTTTGTVTIGAYNTYLASGGFTLSPGQTASVSGTVAHFLVVGQ